jgi:hypothetical protein
VAHPRTEDREVTTGTRTNPPRCSRTPVDDEMRSQLVMAKEKVLLIALMLDGAPVLMVTKALWRRMPAGVLGAYWMVNRNAFEMLDTPDGADAFSVRKAV